MVEQRCGRHDEVEQQAQQQQRVEQRGQVVVEELRGSSQVSSTHQQ